MEDLGLGAWGLGLRDIRKASLEAPSLGIRTEGFRPRLQAGFRELQDPRHSTLNSRILIIRTLNKVP